MRRLTLPLVLGLAHGVADGAAGLLLGGLAHTRPLTEVGLLLLLYNLLAFGGQPVAGLLVDRVGRPRAAALAGLLLLGAALLAGGAPPHLAVALAGAGSAAFHVGGGALACCATRGRTAGPGLFAAPGVVGLATGGALATAGYLAAWPFLLLLLGLAVALMRLPLPALPYRRPAHDEPLFEGHDLVMLALLAAIALRSAVWSSVQFLLQGRIDMLLALAVAAALGKILGGLLADRLGWRRWTMSALLGAAALLTLGGQQPAPLLLGVALLQSATPATLAAAARLLPQAPALAMGLTLGLAVAIGGVPVIGGWSGVIGAPPGAALLLLAAALALWWSLRPRADIVQAAPASGSPLR